MTDDGPKIGNESGYDVAHQVIGVVMTVTPFLPPPANAGVTGVLAVVNFLISAFEPNKPDPPNPFDVLGKNLEAFAVSQEVRQQLGKIQTAGDLFNNATAALTTPLNQVKRVSTAVTDLDKRLTTEFRKDVDDALGDLFTLLETQCTTEKYKDVLDVIFAGVTTSLLLWNAQVQIAAIAASVAKANGDAGTFDDKTDAWTTLVRNAANDLEMGASDATQTGSTTPTSTDARAVSPSGKPATDSGDGPPRPTSYIPKIEAWMTAAIDTRCNNIKVEQWGDPDGQRGIGYTFVDPADPDCTPWTHFQRSTRPGGGESHIWVSSEPAVRAALQDYISELRVKLRAQFDSYETVITSWRTYVAGFKEMLPAPAPKEAPTVVPKAGGPPTPTGVWTEGTRVRYAITANNEIWPSTSGPWSEEYVVGTTAHTTLTLPQPPGVDAIDVYRQMKPPGADWQEMETILVIKPLVSQCDDVNDFGGDAW